MAVANYTTKKKITGKCFHQSKASSQLNLDIDLISWAEGFVNQVHLLFENEIDSRCTRGATSTWVLQVEVTYIFSLLYSFVTVFSLVSHLAVVSVTATNAKHSIKRMKEIPGDQQES